MYWSRLKESIMINPILPSGGTLCPPPWIDLPLSQGPSCTKKLPNFVPFGSCQRSRYQVSKNLFWYFFLERKWKYWMSKIFYGPRAFDENKKKKLKNLFFMNKTYFFGKIWIVHALSFHFKCITPVKLKKFKVLNFSTITLIEICHPLAA